MASPYVPGYKLLLFLVTTVVEGGTIVDETTGTATTTVTTAITTSAVTPATATTETAAITGTIGMTAFEAIFLYYMGGGVRKETLRD